MLRAVGSRQLSTLEAGEGSKPRTSQDCWIELLETHAARYVLRQSSGESRAYCYGVVAFATCSVSDETKHDLRPLEDRQAKIQLPVCV